MEQQNTRLRNAGFATFFFSGICAISAGVVVSLLQERYGFAYGMTGTLLSLMSVGNLLAGLLMGMLPSALGMKRSVLLLTIGYAVGYAVMGLTGAVALLAAAFFVVGIAKGSVINTCTILVSDHSADRTRGMNLMHSCYACGALLCPFLIAAAARVSTELAVFLLAAVGLVLWLVYVFTPLRGGKSKSSAEKEAIDWSFLRSARFWITLFPERRRAERQRLDGDLLQGQRHYCGHAGGLHRHCDVGRYAGGTVAHRLCVPLKKSPQGHGGHERAVHRVLCAAGHGAHAGRSHCAAVCLCHLHVRAEPHRRGQRRPHDQRDQHGHHAAGGLQRRHPDAVGYRHRGGARGACRRYGLQHRALHRAGGLYHSGGKTAGGMMCRLPITLSVKMGFRKVRRLS